MLIGNQGSQDFNQTAKGTPDGATHAAVTVKVLRSLPEIEEFRSVWMQFQRHPNSDIDFYLEVLKSLPGILRPHVMVAFRNTTPMAVLVGRLENSHVGLKVGYADFFRLRARALTFIYGGILGDPCSETCEMLVLEIMRSLRQGEADMAYFNHLRSDSPLYDALCRRSGVLSRDYFPALQIHRRMTIPASPDEFWERFSPKVRKNQRWQAKKLLNDFPGKVRICCFQDAKELERMMSDVEEIANKTYQRGLGVGFVADSATRDRLYLRAEKGWLRTFVLYVSDRPCAFWLGTLYQGTFHSDSMGYNPEFGKYSPGMYLVMRVIEDFCKKNGGEEVAAIDFGLGDAQYKELLGNAQWQDASLHVFGSTLRGLGLNALRTPIIFIDRLGKRLVERANLLPRIKKLWRNRVAQSEIKDGVQALGQPGAPTRGREKREPVNAE